MKEEYQYYGEKWKEVELMILSRSLKINNLEERKITPKIQE
jgi:hypothetical protein